MATREYREAFKGKGPTTRQLLREVAEGKTVRPVWGLTNPVHHEPRTKFDPQPWTDGFFRYHAWELFAEKEQG